MTRRQAVCLVLIVAAGITMRLLYLYADMHAPGFGWDDPDQYLHQAQALTRSGHWRWTRAAVDYFWGGRRWELPPGYPIFLSLFYRADSSSPMAAAIAQCVVGGLSCAAVFTIGRYLHSVRAGLVAAVVWACWFPSIAAARVFVQEQWYLPLLWTAFAAVAWALDRPSPRRCFTAGLLLGAAALTRAMPLFFTPVVLPIFWWASADRRAAARAAALFAAGVALLVVPYVIWLSLANGQLVIVDNHMMIEQSASRDPRELGTIVSMLVDIVKTGLASKVGLAMGMLKIYGPNWLYHYGGAASAGTAWRTALFVHVGTDTLFVAAVILAPVGLALARQTKVAVLLFAWVAFVVAVSVTLGYSGARYRSSIEALLVCGAAVVPAARWRRPAVTIGALAGAATLGLALYVLPQYAASWRAPVPFGLHGWSSLGGGREQTYGRGASAFYTAMVAGRMDVQLEAWPESEPGDLLVKVNGVDMQRVTIAPGHQTAVRVDLPNQPIAFVELAPTPPNAALVYYIRAPR